MAIQQAPPVAMITGATGGIGAAIAKRLSKSGYALVLTARSSNRLRALAADLTGPTKIIDADILDPDLPERLLSAALESFGRCDVCVNNAGILEVGTIADIDVGHVGTMVQTNVEAAFRLSYIFLKQALEQNSGHLLMMSSVLGTKTRPTAGAYAGTKFALEALAEALRIELANTNVRVSCLQPGLVRTGLHDHLPSHPADQMGIPEPLQPDDVARAALFVLDQPPHVRIPKIMLLPKGHEI